MASAAPLRQLFLNHPRLHPESLAAKEFQRIGLGSLPFLEWNGAEKEAWGSFVARTPEPATYDAEAAHGARLPMSSCSSPLPAASPEARGAWGSEAAERSDLHLPPEPEMFVLATTPSQVSRAAMANKPPRPPRKDVAPAPANDHVEDQRLKAIEDEEAELLAALGALDSQLPSGQPPGAKPQGSARGNQSKRQRPPQLTSPHA
eukprot:gnl/MRDRNA2_/MRDRNA2_113175_c0_seq1.p1 gnl/MRDRNA2_/MRDRNA2_113175_c0~~gnl/MRDRNA2_/MRDRNA2_113175_c0_seq1.p1  ORF type:complete len:204 (+),score=41.05 gnl/MRDRNA2_/MRDRNA2_113175_c0_seq1:78-689(+)